MLDAMTVRGRVFLLAAGLAALGLLAPTPQAAGAAIQWPCEGVDCGAGEPDCEAPCWVCDHRFPQPRCA